jgi:hypothetical protein
MSDSTKIETKAEIKARYVGLRETYLGLVGTLYPAIAHQELMELRERYVAGTDSFWGDLPTIAKPRQDGSAPHG